MRDMSDMIFVGFHGYMSHVNSGNVRHALCVFQYLSSIVHKKNGLSSNVQKNRPGSNFRGGGVRQSHDNARTGWGMGMSA